MPQMSVSIVKSTSFRGAQQEFANTYTYATPPVDQVAYADTLINAIVDLERPMFAANVNFVRARAWSSGGTKAQNEQLAQKILTGTGGAGSTPASYDRERAFLVRARAGNDSKGRPVYLRKWWHLNGGFLVNSLTDAQLGNTAQLDSSQRTQLAAKFDLFKTIVTTGSPIGSTLRAESGREITGNTQAHPYLEHRQLGDMWR
jgi:hypothetical protein